MLPAPYALLHLIDVARSVGQRALPDSAVLAFEQDASAPLMNQLSWCLPLLAQDALNTGNDTHVMAFLEAGVPVLAEDLADVCEGGPRVVAALIARGLDLKSARNNLDETPLHTTARWHTLHGFRQCWELLLDAGVDPNAENLVGLSAWEEAIDAKRGITAREVMMQKSLPIPGPLADLQAKKGLRNSSAS